MKIVHATTVHPAGDNRIAYKECRSAAEHGHEVVLVAARGDKPDIPGVEVVIVEGASTRFGRFTSVVPAVAKAVLRAQPDIVHIHDPELLLVARRLSKHAPVVFDMHEDIPAQIRTKEWVPRVLRTLLVGIWRLTLGLLDSLPPGGRIRSLGHRRRVTRLKLGLGRELSSHRGIPPTSERQPQGRRPASLLRRHNHPVEGCGRDGAGCG